MSTAIRVLAGFLFAATAVFAQEPRDLRATATERAVQMRVQVLYPGGTTLFDSDWKSGNLLDWSAADLPYGSYRLRISSRDLDGKLTEKETRLQVSPDRIAIDPPLPEDLKLTTTAHDGTTGQIITTSGDLSFRFGDYLNCKDTEAMRLSPEGNLDVKGWIRAGQGILFSDGTLVDSKAAAEKKLKTKADASGTGTLNQISKWIDNVGTLGDSAVSEVSGNVGIGTTTPSGKLHIYGAANADLFAGMGVDMTAGPAFNMGYGGETFGRSAGFLNVRPDSSATPPNPSLRFMTANIERMIITNAGNVGIGTSTPGGKLQVFAAPTADVYAGFGTDMNVGPSLNFGYGGATFGRGAGFFNARPDVSATAPNPSLRFMTNNAERMIITNAGNVGIGTSAPTQTLDVNGNVNAGTLTLSGDLALPSTASLTVGVITLGGSAFAHDFGTNNTFLGINAGNFTMSGLGQNTAIGTSALASNTTGISNTATGREALTANTTGVYNTAFGQRALTSNTIGGGNMASGHFALHDNTVGGNNTACGDFALQFNNTGSNNIGLGNSAGGSLTTGDNNIDIGSVGTGGEANTIRIGKPATQTRAFIIGIRGVTTGANDAIPVLIDSNGQLGTASSSRHYKFDIADMKTDKLMSLHPVTFRYIAHGDNGPLQYGLIAEEVAEVYPELVTRTKDGQPETVMYQFLAPMLLNEVEKQQRTITKQQTTIDRLEQRLEALEKQIATR